MKIQALINAQVEVNRALFLLHSRRDRNFTEVDATDAAITKHIDQAIKDLTEAKGEGR